MGGFFNRLSVCVHVYLYYCIAVLYLLYFFCYLFMHFMYYCTTRLLYC